MANKNKVKVSTKKPPVKAEKKTTKPSAKNTKVVAASKSKAKVKAKPKVLVKKIDEKAKPKLKAKVVSPANPKIKVTAKPKAKKISTPKKVAVQAPVGEIKKKPTKSAKVLPKKGKHATEPSSEMEVLDKVNPGLEEDEDLDELSGWGVSAKSAERNSKYDYGSDDQDEDIDASRGSKKSNQQDSPSLYDEHDLKGIFEEFKRPSYFVSESDECIERNCDAPATTLGNCRYHYIANWTHLKKKFEILDQGKLQLMIEELIKKYPLKYIESMAQDLSEDREFFKVLSDLNIETSFDDLSDADEDDDGELPDETRGFSADRGSLEEDI